MAMLGCLACTYKDKRSFIVILDGPRGRDYLEDFFRRNSREKAADQIKSDRGSVRAYLMPVKNLKELYDELYTSGKDQLYNHLDEVKDSTPVAVKTDKKTTLGEYAFDGGSNRKKIIGVFNEELTDRKVMELPEELDKKLLCNFDWSSAY